MDYEAQRAIDSLSRDVESAKRDAEYYTDRKAEDLKRDVEYEGRRIDGLVSSREDLQSRVSELEDRLGEARGMVANLVSGLATVREALELVATGNPMMARRLLGPSDRGQGASNPDAVIVQGDL